MLLENQDKLMIAGAIIGSNVGVYTCADDGHTTSGSFFIGIALGGVAGGLAGFSFPFIAPLVTLSLPGYGMAKLHSSLLESQQKEERLAKATHQNLSASEQVQHELQLR